MTPAAARRRRRPCPLVIRDAEFVKVPWVFGLQHYVFLADGALAVSYTEDGRDHLAVLDAPAGAEPRPARGLGAPRARLALHGRVLARAARRPRRPRSPPCTRRARRSPSSIRAPATAEVVRRGRPVLIDPAYISRPEAIIVPHGGRPQRARQLLPAGEPGLRRAGGRAAAAAGQRPRRPDLGARGDARPRRPVLDVARHRRGRRQLRRVDRLRPRVPGAAARRVGSRGHRRLHQRRALPRRSRRRRPGAHRRPRRERRRLHDAERAHALRLLQRRRQPVRPRRPGDVRHRRHAQVRVAVPRQPARARIPSGATSTASVRRSTTSTTSAAR